VSAFFFVRSFIYCCIGIIELTNKNNKLGAFKKEKKSVFFDQLALPTWQVRIFDSRKQTIGDTEKQK